MGLFQRLFKQAAHLFTLAVLLLFMQQVYATEKILVWGDSLSAAYGIPVEKGWVNLMQQELGDSISIVNGSVSGETTQGGITRLPAALTQYQPDLVILELGANDGLRGIPPRVTKQNLKKMIQMVQNNNARVILLGMKIPPNYGVAYSRQFESTFTDLAKEFQLPFIPFFLDKVITRLDLLQEDELHPTAKAQPMLMNEVLPVVNKVLKLAIKKPT